MELKYSEILQRNAALSRNLPDDRYEIAILSNVVVFQAKEILEYALRSEKVPAVVEAGDYDNIVQDSVKYKAADLVIVFWDLCNIIDGLQFKIELFDQQTVEEIFEQTKAQMNLVFKNLEDTSLVLFNAFTGIQFSGLGVGGTNLERLAARLNEYLRVSIPRNVKLVELEKVIAHVGVNASTDLRNFYSSKAPYTIDFFRAYSRHIKPYVMSANGRSKKVVVFDCDNTLWKGVLGEEGYAGIEMSPATKDGAVFAEVQSIALSLNRQGVLIGLCSKNNAADVKELIGTHPDMQIKEEHIAARRINWSDKASNLREIAKELNLGLDSFVMVDDSPFEANLIKEQLPEVTVLQVPERLSEYPKLLRENCGLFYDLSSTAEDARKADMYKEQEERENNRHAFADITSYLASLKMKMTVYRGDKSIVPRMAQLTQKTNQFNLTTRRYTERDIERFLNDKCTEVFAFSMSDKFGDSGVTGLGVVRTGEHNRAVIDTFLMSCRVIGRDVEYAFMDHLMRHLKDRKVELVSAQYIKTQKNDQVKEFLDRCSFQLQSSTEEERNYLLNINDYQSKQIDYVEIIDHRWKTESRM
jgi:FkbH-like protein